MVFQKKRIGRVEDKMVIWAQRMIEEQERGEKRILKYTTAIEATNERAYDEVSRYLGDSCHHFKRGEGKINYFFDEKETQAIRTDGKNIEISDLVQQDIINSVKHILNSERRGNDLN